MLRLLEGVSRGTGQRQVHQIIYYFRENGLNFLGELNPTPSRPDTLGPLWRLASPITLCLLRETPQVHPTA